VDAVVAQMAQIKKKVAANLPSVCAPYVKHTSSSTKELKLGTKPQQHLAGGSVNTDKKQNRDGKAKKAKMVCIHAIAFHQFALFLHHLSSLQWLLSMAFIHKDTDSKVYDV
jgi:hypothetical protein